MKLEIEITEDEIRFAIERKIRVAVEDYTGSWSTDNYIKNLIKQHWQEVAEKVVIAELSNSAKLTEKVRNSIEAKLKAQLTAMMKVKT